MTIDKDKAITVLGMIEAEMNKIKKDINKIDINTIAQSIEVLAKLMKDMISQPPE